MNVKSIRCIWLFFIVSFVGGGPHDALARTKGLAPQTDRVALVVWHNQGWQKGTRPDKELRYARQDALLVAKVLRAKGQFQVKLLGRPTSAQLQAALGRLLQMSRNPGKKLHFLFYYSGHADERYLHLGPASQAPARRFSFQRLAQFFKKLQASVKIGIIDACNSGSLIDLLHARVKGRGRGYAPYFKVPASLTQGMAILTSASTGGQARELKRLNASLFTYHLVRGLWGRADQNKDGRVTSIEAYEYARLMIERDLPGRQNPMFLNHFRGEEAYPITLAFNASLVISASSGEQFTLLGEQASWRINGKDKRPRVVSLMAGKYRIFLRDRRKKCFSQRLQIKPQQKKWLSRLNLPCVSLCVSGWWRGLLRDPPILSFGRPLPGGSSVTPSPSRAASPSVTASKCSCRSPLAEISPTFPSFGPFCSRPVALSLPCLGGDSLSRLCLFEPLNN